MKYKYKCFSQDEHLKSENFIKDLGDKYIEDWYQTETGIHRVRVIKYF